MSASSVQTTKGSTRVPGVYNETKVVGIPLATPGAKVLVLIGEAEGAEPGKIHTLTRPGAARALFRSGDLLDAALMAFDPSRSAKIAGRPAQVFAYKTNPAAQSAVTLGNGDGDALVLTSRDYGLFTSRIGVDLTLGTNQGFKVDVELDGKTESADDLGGVAAFTANYPTAGDAATMQMVVTDTEIRADYTVARAGLEITDPAAAGLVEVLSSSAYDAHQRVTVYGLDAGGDPVFEVFALNGMAAVVGSQTFGQVTGWRVDGATAGVITVQEDGAGGVLDTTAATLSVAATGKVEVVSTDADDTGRIVVEGLSAAGNPIAETLTLAGLGVVAGAMVFDKVTRARLVGVAEGNVSVRQNSDNAVAFTIAAGNLTAGVDISEGLYLPDAMAFDSVISTILDAASVGAVLVVRGLNRAGAAVAEKVALLDSAVPTLADVVQVTQIELGALPAARIVTLSGTAASSKVAERPLLRDAVAYFNALPGFAAATASPAAFKVVDLDSASQSIRSETPVAFGADLVALVEWFNASSRLVSAAASAGATGAPSVLAQRAYLVGGAEGTTTMDHWRAALLAAKKATLDAAFKASRQVIVPLSDSDAVHNLINGELRVRDGVHEAAAFLGLATTKDKPAIKTAIRAVNNRQVAFSAQQVVAFDDSGAERTMPAWSWPVLLGALMCGSRTAEPLTEAEGNAIRTVNHASWDAVDDIEEMIAAGLIVVHGRQVVRSVSSWLEDDNRYYTEVSTNESLDDSAFNMRRALRPLVGAPDFDGSASTLRSAALAELERQVTRGEIKTFNPEGVVVTDIGDGFDVDYEIEPVEPINFIRPTAYAQPLSVRI